MKNKKIDAMIEKCVLNMPVHQLCKATVFRLAKDVTVSECELVMIVNLLQVLGYLNEPFYTEKVVETIKKWNDDDLDEIDNLFSKLRHSVSIDLKNGGFNVIT